MVTMTITPLARLISIWAIINNIHHNLPIITIDCPRLFFGSDYDASTFFEGVHGLKTLYLSNLPETTKAS